ncbi:unnamed protein product [Urochloa decumbens]|uniref:Uncharacterized protein n=1 Tax=Urochloa decumbens TaxID=240449 RepID=A0ABC9EI97_9POAL
MPAASGFWSALLSCLVNPVCSSNLAGLHLHLQKLVCLWWQVPFFPSTSFYLTSTQGLYSAAPVVQLVFEVEAKTQPRIHVYFTITTLCIVFPSVFSASPAVALAAPSLMVFMEATATSRAEVDTSRPFQSVRQAVEVFGERYSGGGSGSSNASSESSVKLISAPPVASASMALQLDCLKKLEEDLAEAKGELVELRQRQAQMEVAVSSLSVQFSKGLAVFSGISKGKEVAVVGEEEYSGHGRVRSDRWDESRAEEWMASLEYLPSLSEALAIKMIEDDMGDRKEKKPKKNSKNKAARKKHRKQRSGISLVGGMFFSKKAKSR